MPNRTGVVILKKKEWAYPHVDISVGGGRTELKMSLVEFLEALVAEIKPGRLITRKALRVQVDEATEKILSEMRESVTKPME
jgi:hypothetical protein